MDSQSSNRSEVVGLFVNLETNYLVSVSRAVVEIFDLKKAGKRLSAHRFHEEIICADFTQTSDYGAVLVVSTKD